MPFAYDGAYARNLDAMVAHGAIAVSVYLTGNFAVPKVWVDQIHARRLGVIPNYEQAADELVYAGDAGGRLAGMRALNACLALGIPADGSVAIVFSVDVNVPQTTANFEAVGRAFDGINAALAGRYLSDFYGEGALGDYLIATGRIRANVKFWLSGSTSFPGFNAKDIHVALVQLVGSPVAGTDQDVSTDPQGIHAWWPVGSIYAAGDSMSQAEVTQVLQGVRQIVHDEVVKLLSDPDHPYLPALHARVAAVAEGLKPTADRVERLALGFDTDNPVPFSPKGELALAIRQVRDHGAPPTVTQIADAVVPRIAPAQAIVDAQAVVDGVMKGVLAALPPSATADEIVAKFRADLAAKPLAVS